jgi:hypothetical protein
MQNGDLIPANDFCHYHSIELSFVQQLGEAGLVHLVVLEEAPFIPGDELAQLEKMMHLHYELDINVEGIEAILHMLRKIEMQQEEMNRLRNRLRLYEDEQ